MLNPFDGFNGIVTGLVVLAITSFFACMGTKGKPSFDFDARGEPGAFEKLLVIYIDLAKFVLGLATGSIVLLVGTSAFRKNEHLPASFASPLFLLALSILYGILLIVFLTIDYEAYRHKTSPYTRFKYTKNLALGYGSLSCFCVGYVWLIFIVTR